MRISVLLVSAGFIAGLSGCASPWRKGDAQERAPASRSEGRSAFGLGSLSDLESVLTEESLNQHFNMLWSASEPEKEIMRLLDQLTKIYYRSELQLRNFDDELELVSKKRAKNRHVLASLDAYPRMLAYHEVSHRAIERFSYIYDRLLTIRSKEDGSEVDRKKVEKILSAITAHFGRAKGSDRLALHNLTVELKSIFDRHAQKNLLGAQENAAHPFVNTLFADGESVVEFARRPEVQDELDQRVQDAQDSLDVHDAQDAESDSETSSETVINSLSSGYREQLRLFTQGARGPQSAGPRIFPSSGSHGTVSGDEYPKGTWSLTFDDGPSAKYSPMVLENLKKHDLHATFFELATNVAAIPKTSLQVLNAGMEMANHSYTHPQLPKIDDAHLRHEVEDSTAVETKVWGESHHPKLFRCPYGAGLTVTRVREMIAENGFIHVFWNVDTLDWQDKNPDSILARAKKQMLAEGRGVILFHDVHPQSVEASRMVMDWIKAKGYRHETVGAVIEELNRNAQKNP